MTEGGCFTAVCALSHFLEVSFLAIIPLIRVTRVAPLKAGHFTIYPNLPQGKMLMYERTACGCKLHLFHKSFKTSINNLTSGKIMNTRGIPWAKKQHLWAGSTSRRTQWQRLPIMLRWNRMV